VIRTRDIFLGKEVLYQLSYTRKLLMISHLRQISQVTSLAFDTAFRCSTMFFL
jgi:hypothetical protein